MKTDELNVLIIGSEYESATKIRSIVEKAYSWKLRLIKASNLNDVLNKCRQETIELFFIINTSDGSLGLDILSALRSDGDDRPIIVVSSVYNDLLAASFIKAGADDYMRDEWLNDELLLKTVRYALERAQMRFMLKRAQQLEHHLAYHDPLTNLPNRKLFIDRLHQAISQSLRSGMYVGVIYLDLDDFKGINDTMGHRAGDLLLQSVAGRLQHTVRKSDTVSRFGGDEFMVILNGINGPRDAARVARKIINEIGRPHHLESNHISTAASVGISIFPWDGDNVDALMRNADKAMYLAKEQNTGYQFFHRAMNEQVEAKIRLEKNLVSALNNNQFELHFQPILNADEIGIHAFEVLLRWNHPDVGMMYPNDFMPVAEDSHLLNELECWVLNKSVEYLDRVKNDNFRVKLSVNIYNRMSKKSGEKDWMECKIKELDTFAENFILEINEPSSMVDLDDMAVHLKQARDSGLEIAIDNFGSGFVSLAILNKLPLDIVKIDRSLFRKDHIADGGQNVLRALVNFTRHVGLKTIATGIETPEQDKLAEKINCNLRQGYYYAMPMPGDQLATYIDSLKRDPRKDVIQAS